jgi:hypothetical protein
LLLVTIALRLLDVVPICGLACAGYPLGTRITGTDAAREGDAATLRLHRDARGPDATVRGGL